jgi:hypothetical protein
MLERLRSALVESYVGTILVGWLFAEGLLHAVGVFTRPLVNWEARVFARSFVAEPGPSTSAMDRIPWNEGLPEALSAVMLLLIAYGLLRWLYYERTAFVIEHSVE